MAFIVSVIGIGFIFLGISAISLHLAYRKYSSDIWKSTYRGEKGFWLEFNRSWILIGNTLYLLIYVFGKETREFFRLDTATKIEYSFLNISYCVILILLLISLYILGWIHFSKGPNILKDLEKKEFKDPPEKYGSYWKRFKKRNKKTGEPKSYFNSYEYPYLCYLLYSAVNFLGLAIFVFSISFYAFLKNGSTLNILKCSVIKVLDSIHSIAQAHAYGIPYNFPALDYFSIKFIAVAGIYSSLFFCSAIIVFCEMFLFQETLSIVGKTGAFWAYCLIMITGVITITVGYFYYEEVYTKLEDKLNELKIIHESSYLIENYIPINIFNKILRRHPIFFPTFITLLLPAIKILRNIGALW
ncbi:hypothetical protein [Floridanema aerugineum]|uniref:Uncharacterized protein n=1 Tax=Floridaenema aerugineum BLCC-F46 TaxID=3153654 RepID=A0ABV4X3H1_9CYAN